MADAYSSSLRTLEIEPGTSTNTWGARLNAATIELLDQAIAGLTGFTLSGSKTLTTANGATDEARRMIINVTGGTGGTVTIPGVSKIYVVRNAASGDVIITTGSGRTATIATANVAYVMCDGVNVDRGVDQADVDACLAAANAYTDNASFEAAAGVLPGQAGNAGRFLTTNGTAASWAALGTAAAYNTGTSGANVPLLNASVVWSGTITATGFIGPLTGNVTGNVSGSSSSCTGNAATATSATTAATATAVASNGVDTGAIQNGAVTSGKLASGVAVANLGYTPLNAAGGTVSGVLNVTGDLNFGDRGLLRGDASGSTVYFDKANTVYLSYNFTTGKTTFVRGGVPLWSVDFLGNAVFAGTVTPSGSP